MGEINIRIQHPDGLLVTTFGIPGLSSDSTNVTPYMTASQRKYENDYRKQSGTKPIQLPCPTFATLEVNGLVATGRGTLDGKPFELTVSGIRFLNKNEPLVAPQPYANKEEKEEAEAGEEKVPEERKDPEEISEGGKPVEKDEVSVPSIPTFTAQPAVEELSNTPKGTVGADGEPSWEDFTEPMDKNSESGQIAAQNMLNALKEAEENEPAPEVVGAVVQVDRVPPTVHADPSSAAKMIDKLEEANHSNVGEFRTEEDMNRALEMMSAGIPSRGTLDTLDLPNEEKKKSTSDIRKEVNDLINHGSDDQRARQPSVSKRPELKTFKPQITFGVRSTAKDLAKQLTIGSQVRSSGIHLRSVMPEPHVPGVVENPVPDKFARKQNQTPTGIPLHAKHDVTLPGMNTNQSQVMSLDETYRFHEEKLKDQLRNTQVPAEKPMKSSWTQSDPLNVVTDESTAKRVFDAYQRKVIEDAAEDSKFTEPKHEEPKPAPVEQKEDIVAKLPKDIADVINEIPKALLGNIEEFSLNEVDLEDVEAGGVNYCIDHRWKSKLRWFAIDDVSSASRILYSSQHKKAYKLSVSLCKEYLRQQ